MSYLIAAKPEPNPFLIVTSGPNRTLMDLPTGAGDSQENTTLNDEIVTAEEIIEEVQRSLTILNNSLTILNNKTGKNWDPQCIQNLMSVDKFPSIEKAKKKLTVARTAEERKKAIGVLILAYNGYIERKKADILKCKNKIARQTQNHLQGSKTPANKKTIETTQSKESIEFQELENERERLF